MGEKQIKVKIKIVDELVEKMKGAQSVVLYNYIGLSVEEVTDLRNRFRKEGVEYRVIKNTTIKRAADILNITGLDEYLHGTTALAFGVKDPVAPAKVLAEFIKAKKKTEIKAGILENKVIDVATVNALAELPSREELIARILGSMNAPVTGTVMVLSGILRSVVCALCAIKDKRESA